MIATELGSKPKRPLHLTEREFEVLRLVSMGNSSEQAAVFFSALAAWLAVTSFPPDGTSPDRRRLALG